MKSPNIIFKYSVLFIILFFIIFSAGCSGQASNAPSTISSQRDSGPAGASPSQPENSSDSLAKYRSYLGTWYTFQNDPDILKLSEIDEYTFRIDINFYQLADFSGAVKMENGKIKVRCKEYGTYLNGILKLENNKIIFSIDETNFEYLKAGRLYVFTIKYE